MSFFVAPSEDFLDLTTEAMTKQPDFADRYDAIKELREADQHRLVPTVEEASRVNGFFRVASLQGPIESLAHLLNPDWMKNKNNFYRWLRKHPQHATYVRRRDQARATFVDGKEARGV